MSIEATTYGILAAAAAVTALTTTARIKPPGDWQDLARPYIIYKPVTFDPSYCHNAETTAILDHWPNLQINIVADTYASARAVSDAVKAAIRSTTNGNHSGTQYFLRNEIVLDFDIDRKIQEIALDFEVFGR
jgi:hypothetical protein